MNIDDTIAHPDYALDEYFEEMDARQYGPRNRSYLAVVVTKSALGTDINIFSNRARAEAFCRAEEARRELANFLGQKAAATSEIFDATLDESGVSY